MNHNIVEVGKPYRWKPGQSGNPAGKFPAQTRVLSGVHPRFQSCLAAVGLSAVQRTAAKNSDDFMARFFFESMIAEVPVAISRQ